MNRKYDDDFKRNTVKKVLNGQSVSSVSRELGVNESLIFKWKKIILANGNGIQSGTELADTETLRKRVRELEMENAHSKKGSPHLRQRKLKRYKFIDDERKNYPIKILSRVMEVSTSGYYSWRRRLTKPPSIRRKTLKQLAANCYWENRKRYGTRRIRADLQKTGVKIGRFQIRGMMKEEGLKAIQPKSFKPRTTDSKGVKAAPNLLTEIKIEECAPTKIIIGDITYLPLKNGKFSYLARVAR